MHTNLTNPHSDELWIFSADQTSVQFEFNSKRYYLAELARGDFNHDGLEDSLVAIQWQPLEGTGVGWSCCSLKPPPTGR